MRLDRRENFVPSRDLAARVRRMIIPCSFSIYGTRRIKHAPIPCCQIPSRHEVLAPVEAHALRDRGTVPPGSLVTTRGCSLPPLRARYRPDDRRSSCPAARRFGGLGPQVVSRWALRRRNEGSEGEEEHPSEGPGRRDEGRLAHPRCRRRPAPASARKLLLNEDGEYIPRGPDYRAPDAVKF